MWPWEAPVFGYLCYSAYCHVRYREPPGGWAVLLVAVGSVVPDLIDKPLNWQFGVFSSGYALGHSIFFGLFVTAVSYSVARRRDAPRLGTALGIGFITHEIGAALEHVVTDGDVWFGLEHMLWPVYSVPPAVHHGFWRTTMRFLGEYLHNVLALRPTPYLVMIGVIGLFTLAVWLADGHPGLRELRIVLAYPVSGRGRGRRPADGRSDDD